MTIATPLISFGNEVALHVIPDLMTVTSATANAYGSQRFPTDPIGSATVTFDGVNAGSEIRVFNSSGIELAGVESCNADHTLSWPVDSTGVSTIRIVHPAYKIKEFDFTPVPGAQSLPVQQEPDKWYLNP